jgi:hypothetical protein
MEAGTAAFDRSCLKGININQVFRRMIGASEKLI